MSAPTYDAYRDSGVATVGAVPSHWRVAPAKYALAARSGGASIKGQCADAPDDGLFQGYSASGPDVWLTDYEFDGPGLVLSAVGARCGKVFLATGKWGVVANTHCLLPTDANVAKFLWYLTNNEAWWEKGGTAQPFVKVPDSLARKIGLPPPAEQAAIAAFLDRETGKIDALVEAQTRLIELLKEKRQAVISHAVTKGLDPAAPMKDSGVEWLGQVPAHWEVVPTRSLISLRRQQVGERHAEFQLLSLTLRGVIVRDRESGHGKFPTEFNTYQVVRPNDLVFCLFDMDETPRTVGISPHNGMITGAYDVFASPDVHIAEFIYWLYLGRDFKKTLRPFYTGLRKVIRKETFGSIPLALPPAAERQAIVAFLNETTRQLDELAAQAEAAVTLLRERRAALISAAVTGKIDVRGLAPEQAEAA